LNTPGPIQMRKVVNRIKSLQLPAEHYGARTVYKRDCFNEYYFCRYGIMGDIVTISECWECWSLVESELCIQFTLADILSVGPNDYIYWVCAVCCSGSPGVVGRRCVIVMCNKCRLEAHLLTGQDGPHQGALRDPFVTRACLSGRIPFFSKD
jgi:hypothetical protein